MRPRSHSGHVAARAMAYPMTNNQQWPSVTPSTPIARTPIPAIERKSSGRPRGPTTPDTFVMALTLDHASHTTNVSPMEVQMSDHDGSPCTRWVRRSMTTTKTRS